MEAFETLPIESLHRESLHVEQLKESPYRAAAIVLQLLLGTLDHAISDLGGQLQGRLHERYQWGAEIVQHYATALAQRQSEQISA